MSMSGLGRALYPQPHRPVDGRCHCAVRLAKRDSPLPGETKPSVCNRIDLLSTGAVSRSVARSVRSPKPLQSRLVASPFPDGESAPS